MGIYVTYFCWAVIDIFNYLFNQFYYYFIFIFIFNCALFEVDNLNFLYQIDFKIISLYLILTSNIISIFADLVF